MFQWKCHRHSERSLRQGAGLPLRRVWQPSRRHLQRQHIVGPGGQDSRRLDGPQGGTLHLLRKVRHTSWQYLRLGRLRRKRPPDLLSPKLDARGVAKLNPDNQWQHTRTLDMSENGRGLAEL